MGAIAMQSGQESGMAPLVPTSQYWKRLSFPLCCQACATRTASVSARGLRQHRYIAVCERARLWCARCRATALWGRPLTLIYSLAKPGSITRTAYYYAQVPLAARRPGTSGGKLVCIYDLQIWKQVGGTTESFEASVNYYYYYYWSIFVTTGQFL